MASLLVEAKDFTMGELGALVRKVGGPDAVRSVLSGKCLVRTAVNLEDNLVHGLFSPPEAQLGGKILLKGI